MKKSGFFKYIVMVALLSVICLFFLGRLLAPITVANDRFTLLPSWLQPFFVVSKVIVSEVSANNEKEIVTSSPPPASADFEPPSKLAVENPNNFQEADVKVDSEPEVPVAPVQLPVVNDPSEIDPPELVENRFLTIHSFASEKRSRTLAEQLSRDSGLELLVKERASQWLVLLEYVDDSDLMGKYERLKEVYSFNLPPLEQNNE